MRVILFVCAFRLVAIVFNFSVSLCRYLRDRLPPETRAEAQRVAELKSNPLHTEEVVANPRWLPSAERVRKVLRNTSMPHRTSVDEQKSLLAMLQSKLVSDANPDGEVLFLQLQRCCCHYEDFAESRLALERKLHSADDNLLRVARQISEVDMVLSSASSRDKHRHTAHRRLLVAEQSRLECLKQSCIKDLGELAARQANPAPQPKVVSE